MLKGSQHLLERKDKELTQHEEEALKNFDLQEALERRKELQKMRALQSYYEAKCRRQKKIKSKKYGFFVNSLDFSIFTRCELFFQR